jgi:DNA-directed RNA polymerase II subunit RPB2
MTTPEDILVTPGGKVLARVLKDFSCLDNNKKAMDSWLSQLGDQVAARSEEIAKGTFITFGPVSIIPPVNSKSGFGKLYPAQSREQKLGYDMEIRTHIQKRRGTDINDPCSGEIIEETVKSVSVGKIYTMLKSSICNLNGKNEAELRARGEDYRDPGGYFIINGNSRTAQFAQQMRVNIFTITADNSQNPPEKVCTTVNDTIRGTVLTTCRTVYKKLPSSSHIQVPKFVLNLNNIRRESSSQGKKKVYFHFNAIRAIRFFAKINDNPDHPDTEQLKNFQDTEYIFNYMLNMTKKDWRRKVKTALIPTYVEALTTIDSHESDQEGEFIKREIENLGGTLGNKKSDNELEEAENIKQAIEYTINSSIITHEKTTNYVQRIQALCMMVVMLAEHEAGYRALTNRDAWRNKRLITPAKRCSQLFRGYFKNFARGALASTANASDTSLKTIINNCSPQHVTEGFQGSFSGPRWGVKTVNAPTESPINDLQMGTFVEMVAMLSSLNTTVDRKTKSFLLRGVQSDQLGFIDAHDSPESSAIGLVLKLAVTTVITVEKPSIPFIKVLKGEVGVTFVEGQAPRKEIYLHTKPEGDADTIVLINGLFKGWCDPRRTLKALRLAKRQGIVDRQSCIVLDEYGTLLIHTDEGRLVRPLLIVNEDTQELVIEEKDLWDAPVDVLFEEGCMEYVDAHEQAYIFLADNYESLKERRNRMEDLRRIRDAAELVLLEPGDDDQAKENKIRAKKDKEYAEYELDVMYMNPYTHAEIHPQARYGPSLTTMPFIGETQAPRISFQGHMGGQAMGTYSTAYERRFKDSKLLMRPTPPVVTQQLEHFLGLDKFPHGTNLIFAFMANGMDQEDALSMNAETVSSGVLSSMMLFSVETIVEKYEYLTRPTKFRENEDPKKYKFLTNQGLPMLESPVAQGDYIIGKVSITAEGEKNVSVPLKVGQSGIVHRVFVTRHKNQLRVVVVIRRPREHQIGDKASSRYAQKGTTAEIVPKYLLPFFEDDGTVPDIFVNPHSVPKRMTIGYIREALIGLLSSLKGEKFNATPFEKYSLDDIYRELEDLGFPSKGYRWMINPITGLRFKAMIFSGPIYMQLLTHFGPEKLQVRAAGPVKLITRQPPRGGAMGGRRVGEMERDAILSHGASRFLYDTLILRSDGFEAPFCMNCGNFANMIVRGDSYTPECLNCENPPEGSGIAKKQPRLGKKMIPYVFKLLTQLMMGMGIQIKFNSQAIEKAEFEPLEDDEDYSDSEDDDDDSQKDEDEEEEEEIEEEDEDEDYGSENDEY